MVCINIKIIINESIKCFLKLKIETMLFINLTEAVKNYKLWYLLKNNTSDENIVTKIKCLSN